MTSIVENLDKVLQNKIKDLFVLVYIKTFNLKCLIIIFVVIRVDKCKSLYFLIIIIRTLNTQF